MLIKFNKEVATANYNMENTKYFPRGYRIFKMASEIYPRPWHFPRTVALAYHTH